MADGGRWLREHLGRRLWVGPGAGLVAAVAAAEGLVRLDRSTGSAGTGFGGDAQAARAMLGTIAGATMTVLGVILTITLAVLALAASAYSPRVLRTVGRDRVVKAVLTVFVATFAFTLDALRHVRDDDVPEITVTAAAGLAFVSLASLIALFHHLASRIQIETVTADVHREALDTIAALPALGEGDAPPVPPPVTAEVAGTEVGRVVRIIDRRLADVAAGTGGTVVMRVRPGDGVLAGAPLAHLHGGRPPSDRDMDRIRGGVEIGVHRTSEQDVAFGLRQLVDVALRALSPGIQDPTTAHEALGRAMDLLARIADRALERVVRDGDGRPLVVVPHPGWAELVGLVCDQVRVTTERQGDVATLAVVADGLGHVRAATTDPARRAAVDRALGRVRAAESRARAGQS